MQYRRYAILAVIVLLGNVVSVNPVSVLADTKTLAPNSTGNFNDWSVSGTTKVVAVSANDGDTTQIFTSNTPKRQTFSFLGANVPVGSIINSVTLNVVAKSVAGANIKLTVEKGTSSSNISDGGVENLDSSYGTRSLTMTTDPFTNQPWTVSEVNTWTIDGLTINFGVRHNGGEETRITQIALVVSYTPLNNPPDLLNPGNKSVNALSTLSFTLSATDPDLGQTLTFSITGGLQPGMSLNSASSAFSWTPTDAQGAATYIVTFTVTDNGSPQLSNSESITITVNDPPVVNDQVIWTVKGTAVPITLIGRDADGNTLTLSIVSGPTNGALGAVTSTGLTSATVTYTPNLDFSGSDSFAFKANDGSLDSNIAIVSVTVNPDALPATLNVEEKNDSVTSFSTDTGGFSSLQRVDEVSLPENKPPLDFTNGIYAFTISGLSSGATVSITITFPSNIPAGSQYWKVQGNTWVKLPDELVGDNDGDNILTLALTDGGIGDSDGSANGAIVDPGGPAMPIVADTTVHRNKCDRKVIITNDPNVAGRCIIVDLTTPMITNVSVTSNGFLCVEAIDDTGIARIMVNGIELSQMSYGSFCAKDIVKFGQITSIFATDFGGNNATAVILDRIDVAKAYYHLDFIDAGKISPIKQLNSLQKVEFDRALQAIFAGESLTSTQQRVLVYATVP